MKIFVLLALLLPVAYSSAHSAAKTDEKHQGHCEGFMPKNDLHLEDGVIRGSAMTKERFEQITDEVVAFYNPIAQAHGVRIVNNKKWKDSTVNASAVQYGSAWHINMYGGLARRPEVTEDGYALVVCHELGHHFGGFPFYSDTKWAASEGQSDYFATQTCARNIWAAQVEENAKHRANIEAIPKAKCDTAYSSEADQNLCYRVANGGKSLATLLGALNKTVPHFDTPDTSVVSTTDFNHPKPQCRLDTYLSGAICKANFSPMVIPGKNAQPLNGIESEKEAATYSCTSAGNYTEGWRPACWYKARM